MLVLVKLQSKSVQLDVNAATGGWFGGGGGGAETVRVWEAGALASPRLSVTVKLTV